MTGVLDYRIARWEDDVDDGDAPWIEQLANDLNDALAAPSVNLRSARAIAAALFAASQGTIFAATAAEIDDLLRSGDASEAAHRLDRWRHPKWADVDECRTAYVRCMEARQ